MELTDDITILNLDNIVKELKQEIKNRKPPGPVPGSVLFESVSARLLAGVFNLPFFTNDNRKRSSDCVKWHGSILNKCKSKKGQDISVFGHSLKFPVDVTLTNSLPQLGREKGSFETHVDKFVSKHDTDPFGLFIVPSIKERCWNVLQSEDKFQLVILDLKALTDLFRAQEFGIYFSHAAVRDLFRGLSSDLKNSLTKARYVQSLREDVKRFVRDQLTRKTDLFISLRSLSFAREISRKSVDEKDLIDGLLQDSLVKKYMGIVDKRILNKDKLTEHLQKSVKNYNLLTTYPAYRGAGNLYEALDCGDLQQEFRFIDEICV